MARQAGGWTFGSQPVRARRSPTFTSANEGRKALSSRTAQSTYFPVRFHCVPIHRSCSPAVWTQARRSSSPSLELIEQGQRQAATSQQTTPVPAGIVFFNDLGHPLRVEGSHLLQGSLARIMVAPPERRASGTYILFMTRQSLGVDMLVRA
jgi:hypothetical protein